MYFHFFSLILYSAINDIKMTQQEDIQKAVEVMRKGGIILYPTDTVWGIGCDATNSEAVAKIYKMEICICMRLLIYLIHIGE